MFLKAERYQSPSRTSEFDEKFYFGFWASSKTPNFSMTVFLCCCWLFLVVFGLSGPDKRPDRSNKGCVQRLGTLMGQLDPYGAWGRLQVASNGHFGPKISCSPVPIGRNGAFEQMPDFKML